MSASVGPLVSEDVHAQAGRPWAAGRDQVNGDLAEVAVQLTREAQAGGHPAHCGADQVVQVAVGRGRQLQGTGSETGQLGRSSMNCCNYAL